jgi:hypothetical protein
MTPQNSVACGTNNLISPQEGPSNVPLTNFFWITKGISYTPLTLELQNYNSTKEKQRQIMF